MRTTEERMLEMIQGHTTVLSNVLKLVDVLNRRVLDLEARLASPTQWRQPEPGKPKLTLVPKGDD